MYNAVTLAGNLTGDPEMRFTNTGKAVANFTVAVNRRTKNGDKWEDVLEGYFHCTCWGKLAENAASSLAKGQRVILSGKLAQRNWKDSDEAGRQGSITVVEVQVDDIGPSLKWVTASVQKPTENAGAAVAEGGF